MTESATPPRTGGVRFLAGLLLFQAVGAIGGGIMLILDPMAEFSQLPVEDLEGSPFDSFLIPGVILLTVLGLFPVATSMGVWFGKTWAWWAAGMIGCGLVIWILAESAIIDFSWLQALYLVIGLFIILAALPRSVRRYCGVGPARGESSS